MDRTEEIRVLQLVVSGLATQIHAHRVQGLVFGSKGLTALADKYEAHANEEQGWMKKFAGRILDLGGELKIEAAPAVEVHDDIVRYLENEKRVSEEGIAQITELLPVLAQDLVAYEDMKTYLIDEDEDLQETTQDLELISLIGLENWLVQKLSGTTGAE